MSRGLARVPFAVESFTSLTARQRAGRAGRRLTWHPDAIAGAAPPCVVRFGLDLKHLSLAVGIAVSIRSSRVIETVIVTAKLKMLQVFKSPYNAGRVAPAKATGCHVSRRPALPALPPCRRPPARCVAVK